jgi:hypothetical protein
MTAVQQATFAKRSGARVTLDAMSGDIVVHDCPRWGRDNMAVLQILRPNAEVTVDSSGSSLSGFTLTVHEPPLLNTSSRLWVAGAITFALTSLLAGLHFLVRLYPDWPHACTIS